ncbi:F-box only protein 48 isoform X2 [Antennarius striatus]|uniref:F-box only protein 48 isoform X2 n=1 Tax=Antennarius striatus TaxID=241820 RepID=UPI0035B48923
MQDEQRRKWPMYIWCEATPTPEATPNAPPPNFAETLPTEMSVRIFSELDAGSLCSASETCRLWRDIIEESDHLWRGACLQVRAVCRREVDRDRRDGLSWKVTLARNYTRSRLKWDWLRGGFSHVRSPDELRGRTMVPLDADTWGEILQAELDR